MNAPRNLDVAADLTLDIDGEAIRIEGAGDVVVVDLPDVRTGRELLRAVPRKQDRRPWIEGVDETLRRMGLTLEVHLDGTRVGRLGTRARPGVVSRLLRSGPAEIRPARRVAAMLRRRPGLTLFLAATLAAIAASLIFRVRGDG